MKLSSEILSKHLFPFLSQRIEQKKIFFIRHAESSYNQWRKEHFYNWSIFYKNQESNYDAQITPKGVQQCRELLSALQANQEITQFDAVYISPLLRALQTFQQISPCKLVKSSTKIYCTDLIRERLDTACDIGHDIKTLKQFLASNKLDQINTTFMTDDQWWSWASLANAS